MFEFVAIELQNTIFKVDLSLYSELSNTTEMFTLQQKYIFFLFMLPSVLFQKHRIIESYFITCSKGFFDFI